MADPNANNNNKLLFNLGMLFLFTVTRTVIVYSIVIAKYLNEKLWKGAIVTLLVEIIIETTLQGIASWVPGYMVFVTCAHIVCTVYILYLNYWTSVPRMRLRDDEFTVSATVNPPEEASRNEDMETSPNPFAVSSDNGELQGQFSIDTEMLITDRKPARSK